MPGQFEGKVALVTGGSAGIGRATALAFARDGAKVVVSDVNVQGGEETADIIKDSGGKSIFIPTDVSNNADVEAMVEQTVSVYGRLDCAHNNAGVAPVRALTHEGSEENWDFVLDINLKGVWLCMKHEIIQMLKQGSGAIVNTASIAGLVGRPKGLSYPPSKAGVIGLTKTAALEYAQSGIRVNAVCPGVIRTAMHESQVEQIPELEQQAIAQHPMGRLGNPEEIAEAVIWLCSDSASFVTGHPLVVDGGLTAH